MLSLQVAFPPISPELFRIEIGSFVFALRWYALAYIGGFLIGWRLIVAALRRPALWPGGVAPMAPERVEILLTWIVLGVILGGRLGYVLFYQPAYYMANPEQILRVWEGGMAFHGGLLGAAAAGWLFSWRNGVAPSVVSDAMAMVVAVGLFLGRVANFINAELWGRPTTMPWGVVFPGHGGTCPQDWPHAVCARHPTQLYEAALEGLLLGLVVWWLIRRYNALARPWLITGTFFLVYGMARFLVEFWREPDPQFLARHPQGHVVSLGELGLTMGQVLSLPLVIAGIGIIALARRRAAA